MMVVDNKFEIKDIVYLKTDREQLPRIVFGIKILSDTILYGLASGANCSDHYDFEISTEKDVLMATND